MERTACLVLYFFGLLATSFSVEYLEVTKCYGGFFMEALCPSGLTITVQGTVFGVSKCNLDARQCCPEPNDCVLDAQQSEPSYYRAIQRTCNGRRRCVDNLRADWTSARTCDSLVPTTDYVTIFYTCSASNGRTPPDSYPSTTVPSLISSLSTILATEFPEGISIATSSKETGGAFSDGTIAGIVVSSVSGFIFLVLLAIYCIRTREPAWAETFNDGIDEIKHKKDIKYLTSNDSSQSSGDKEKKAMSDNEGALNPGFTAERETPRYIRPTHLPQPPPMETHPYYTGAEVVKTPQQAINMMDNHYKDEEDQYDVIDDVLSRFTPSTGSMKKKSLRTLSVPPTSAATAAADGKASVRKTTSHTGIEKFSINDQIYYSPFSLDQALRPYATKEARTPSRRARLKKKAASFGTTGEAYYNGNESVVSEWRDDKTYEGLSVHPGSHSYETMSPSPQPGRSPVSGNTTYSLVNDPEHDLYYSDVIAGVHNFNHDENTYSDVEL